MKKNKGITLVALVITIIILLILAGITISQLTGSGLFENAKLSKEKSTRAEMTESLTLALQELQLEKKAKATISDVTQEWLDSKLKEYKNTVTEDAENNSKTITMKKNGITVNYVLDEKLGIKTTTEQVVETPEFKIEVTKQIVSTSTSATESDKPGLLTKGTESYIKFTTNLDDEGVSYTVSPELPYKVLGNGIYTFTITGTYEGEIITQEVKVTVNQYAAPVGFVQYDAGDWTQEEIEQLQSKSLYDINISKTNNATFKLLNSSGLNFTFGSFTYKGDTTNSEAINAGTITTSRNKSVAPQSGFGTPTYDGWQVLKTETKTDENGNKITNEDGTERIYVKQLIHAGSPENFIFVNSSSNGNSNRAEYLLSNGQRQTSYSKLSNGTTINPRSWDMYKDKELDSKEYIEEVHVMSYNEGVEMTGNYTATTGIRNTKSYYWTSTSGGNGIYFVLNDGSTRGSNSGSYAYCFGIRPIVILTDGVYIASGDGTAESPYVLGKE